MTARRLNWPGPPESSRRCSRPTPHARVSVELRLRRAVLPRLRVEVPGVDEALLTLGRTARELVRFVCEEAERRVADAPLNGMRLELPSVFEPCPCVGHRAIGPRSAGRRPKCGPKGRWSASVPLAGRAAP